MIPKNSGDSIINYMKTSWQKGLVPPKTYPELAEKISADVVVIGGGITGTTLAYLLAKEGKKKVVVLEKGSLLESGETARTTAFLTYKIDTDFRDLERIFGLRRAKMIYRSGIQAIDKIEEIIKKEEIKCDFVRVNQFIFAESKSKWKEIRREAEEEIKSGFKIEIKEKGRDLPFENFGYVVVPDQAKFHPLKYIEALREKAEKEGVSFFENTEALHINGEKNIIVKTPKGKVLAPWAVISTYNPFNKPTQLFGKKGMYTSYILEIEIPKGVFEEGLYLDNENPYHYFRIDPKSHKHDIMILGGEDHRVEIKMNPEKNYDALLEFAERILEGQPHRIVSKWTGGILETWDGLPFIGAYSKKQRNRLVATGFSGNGMTYSMIAGKILTNKILGKSDPYYKVFRPKRGYCLCALFIKGRDYLEEFINGAFKKIIKNNSKKKKEE